MGQFTIFEQILKTQLSYLQLVGTARIFPPFFSTFSILLPSASKEAGLSLFFSACLSLGSLNEIFKSLSSKYRNPSRPSFSIQLTIFFIYLSPILWRCSLYLLFRLSSVLLIRLPDAISSNVFWVIWLALASASSISMSSWMRQLIFFTGTVSGSLPASTFSKNCWQVISDDFLILGGSGCSKLLAVLPLATIQRRLLTMLLRDLVRFSNSDMSVPKILQMEGFIDLFLFEFNLI